MKTSYNVMTTGMVEIRERELEPGCAINRSEWQEVLATYDTLEEAKKDLAMREPSYRKFKGVSGWLYEVEEFYIEEDDGSGIYDTVDSKEIEIEEDNEEDEDDE